MTLQERQLEMMLKKQRMIFTESVTKEDKASAVGMWIGFLNGLRITNAITHERYVQAYDDMKNTVNEMEGMN